MSCKSKQVANNVLLAQTRQLSDHGGAPALTEGKQASGVFALGIRAEIIHLNSGRHQLYRIVNHHPVLV